jgi:tryptophanyl-tRNA synthetase
MVVDQLKWYQQKGAMLSLPIADLESYAARGMSFEKGREIAVDEYLTNWIALGLDLEKDNVNVYLQSQNKSLLDLAFKASSKTNFNQLKAIYGFTQSTNIAHVQAPLMQVADILLPQIEEFGGPKKVVVPVGVDQDPHIRLTRDIAHRLNEELGFLQPASTYHRFLTGLTGDKMSSSKPNTAIYLNEEPEVAAKKVKTAKTGGRESLKEQEELGGEVDKCVIYEMLVYHLIDDDKELEKIRGECLEGKLRCGDCKARTAELMQRYFEDLKDKQVEASEIAQTII